VTSSELRAEKDGLSACGGSGACAVSALPAKPEKENSSMTHSELAAKIEALAEEAALIDPSASACLLAIAGAVLARRGHSKLFVAVMEPITHELVKRMEADHQILLKRIEAECQVEAEKRAPGEAGEREGQ